MSDNDDDKLHDNILNEPIGTFPIDNTSDNIVLGNKYKYYTDEENAIKEAHQKNQ